MVFVVYVGNVLSRDVSNEDFLLYLEELIKEKIELHLASLSFEEPMNGVVNGDEFLFVPNKQSSRVFDLVLDRPEFDVSFFEGGLKDITIVLLPYLMNEFKERLSSVYGAENFVIDDYYILIDIQLIDRKVCLFEIGIVKKD